MKYSTIVSINPNGDPILVLKEDNDQVTTDTYVSRRYMCLFNNVIFNPFYMKRKVEDYNLILL